MAKKIDDAEVKKECPSCGLGVALDATICEFCGWDFEEEDEWILQIEKLERDLLLEKQKFEPGSVNEKIEATLHRPAEEMKAIKSAEEKTHTAPVPEPAKAPAPTRQAPRPEPRPAHMETRPAAATVQTAPSPKVRRVRTMRTAASAPETEGGLVTKVQTEGKQAPATEASAPSDATSKKVRLVRKVK